MAEAQSGESAVEPRTAERDPGGEGRERGKEKGPRVAFCPDHPEALGRLAGARPAWRASVRPHERDSPVDLGLGKRGLLVE